MCQTSGGGIRHGEDPSPGLFICAGAVERIAEINQYPCSAMSIFSGNLHWSNPVNFAQTYQKKPEVQAAKIQPSDSENKLNS
jgi:hypothetical protein